MKQHITEDQLEELSKESVEELRIWYKKYKGQSIPGSVCGECSFGYYDDPILSIGQMIEFLLEKDKLPFDEDGRPALPVYTYPISNEAICDALWEAVKKTIQI